MTRPATAPPTAGASADTAEGSPEAIGPFAHLGPEFAELQLPSTDAEEWRYSRVGSIEPSRFARAAAAPPPEAVAVAEAAFTELVATVPDGPAAAVLLVDGVVVRTTVPEGVAPEEAVHLEFVEPEATAAAPDVFARLNAQLTPTEVVARVPRHARPDAPVVVVSVASADHVIVAPRLRVELEANSAATVVEVHRTLGGVTSLVLPVTRLVVGRDATVHHVVVQDVADSSDVIGSVGAEVGSSGTYDGWIAAIGGRYARARLDCRLAGRGASGRLAALYTGGGDQMRDLRTFQDHLDRDTTSHLAFKGAVGDRAHAVYTGLIRIHPEAPGSNAEQSNRIMTLSDDAWAESVPNLEIEHNDVRCAHASTVGPVDADQRFYLETRGVPTDVAERLIVAGFFDEVLDQCPVPAVADLVRPRVSELLGGDVS